MIHHAKKIHGIQLISFEQSCEITGSKLSPTLSKNLFGVNRNLNSCIPKRWGYNKKSKSKVKETYFSL